MATIILGAQWGDEGKGKVSDILCGNAQICARAAGGHNAGHSVHVGDKSYDFHLLPSGLVNPNCINLIGSGVVVSLRAFWDELKNLEAKGLEGIRQRLYVSDRANLCLDLHALVDGLEERERQGNKVGTTGRGIGPSYACKASRSGIRIHDLYNDELFTSKLRQLADGYKARFGDLLKYDVEEEISRLREYRTELAPFVVDAVQFMHDAQKRNAKILCEGANALMLDIDYGTVPYVTSSATTLGGVIQGLALSPAKIGEIIGVVKAYTTRVGAGIFKTEDEGEIGTKLQEIGREWGVSTGRRRRCGWLDLVVLKYSTTINHYTALNLTKLDVLDTFPFIQVATAYKDPSTGEMIDYFPADLGFLEKCEVVYEEFEGWQTPTTAVKKFEDLPPQAQAYVKFIEDFVNVPVKWIGTGPLRDDMIFR